MSSTYGSLSSTYIGETFARGCDEEAIFALDVESAWLSIRGMQVNYLSCVWTHG
jgi:hypothetical protein